MSLITSYPSYGSFCADDNDAVNKKPEVDLEIVKEVKNYFFDSEPTFNAHFIDKKSFKISYEKAIYEMRETRPSVNGEVFGKGFYDPCSPISRMPKEIVFIVLKLDALLVDYTSYYQFYNQMRVKVQVAEMMQETERRMEKYEKKAQRIQNRVVNLAEARRQQEYQRQLCCCQIL